MPQYLRDGTRQHPHGPRSLRNTPECLRDGFRHIKKILTTIATALLNQKCLTTSSMVFHIQNCFTTAAITSSRGGPLKNWASLLQGLEDLPTSSAGPQCHTMAAHPYLGPFSNFPWLTKPRADVDGLGLRKNLAAMHTLETRRSLGLVHELLSSLLAPASSTRPWIRPSSNSTTRVRVLGFPP